MSYLADERVEPLLIEAGIIAVFAFVFLALPGLVGLACLNLANIELSKAWANGNSTFQPDDPHLDMAEVLLQRAIDYHRANAQAYRNLGRVYSSKQEYADAVKVLLRSADLSAGDALAHFELGKAYMAMGKEAEAIAAWRRGGAARYFAEMGKKHAEDEDFEQAEAAFRLALAVDPNLADAYYFLAGISWGRDQRQALWALERAIEIDRKPSARRYFSEGQIYLERQEWDDATGAFLKTLALDPDWPDLHLFLGIALRERGELEKAKREFLKEIEIHPTSWSYINLGHVYRDQGEYALALSCYERAREIEPTNSKAYAWAGRMYRELDRPEEAILAMKTAIGLDPATEWYQLDLARLYSDLSQFDDAIAQYQQLLAINPDHIPAREEMERMWALRAVKD